jgi:two-component system OmpR family sensor kinase
VRRLPVRWQVTLAFAGALAVVLLAVGAFVYLRFETELTNTVDAGLQTRAAEVTALRGSGGSLDDARSSALLDDEESFAQVLSAQGDVLDATPGAARVRLSASELRAAAAGPLFLERSAATVDGEPARLLAVPARSDGEVVVVGASLDDRQEAQSALLALMAAGFGAALLLASAAGYWVAGIAQRLTRLERARAAEREAVARERRFIADASHELRTPLTTLKSELDVALQRERSPDELRAALGSAREEADRLVALAEDLLVLARADEGELPITRAPLDVGALLADVAERRGAGAGRAIDVSAPSGPGGSAGRAIGVAAPSGRGGSAGREIRVDAPAGLVLDADRRALERAVGNLVDNALTHGSGPVELSAADGAGAVRIAVRDHGPGFPPGFADRAFERFARPDAGRSGGGAGLGLAIVDAIVRAHGGSVVTSAADPGARVEIVLPASSSPHPPAGR